jgi:hypothetical protein
MAKKIHPKFKDMTEEQIEAWEERMKYLEGDNTNKNATGQINMGRGWIF